jgi:hypothetical protein
MSKKQKEQGKQIPIISKRYSVVSNQPRCGACGGSKFVSYVFQTKKGRIYLCYYCKSVAILQFISQSKNPETDNTLQRNPPPKKYPHPQLKTMKHPYMKFVRGGSCGL